MEIDYKICAHCKSFSSGWCMRLKKITKKKSVCPHFQFPQELEKGEFYNQMA